MGTYQGSPCRAAQPFSTPIPSTQPARHFGVRPFVDPHLWSPLQSHGLDAVVLRGGEGRSTTSISSTTGSRSHTTIPTAIPFSSARFLFVRVSHYTSCQRLGLIFIPLYEVKRRDWYTCTRYTHADIRTTYSLTVLYGLSARIEEELVSSCKPCWLLVYVVPHLPCPPSPPPSSLTSPHLFTTHPPSNAHSTAQRTHARQHLLPPPQQLFHSTAQRRTYVAPVPTTPHENASIPTHSHSHLHHHHHAHLHHSPRSTSQPSKNDCQDRRERREDCLDPAWGVGGGFGAVVHASRPDG